MRDVGAFLHLTPAEGGWRVVIVDGAEEMNINAANAVLKMLEEPPRQALLLLVRSAGAAAADHPLALPAAEPGAAGGYARSTACWRATGRSWSRATARCW